MYEYHGWFSNDVGTDVDGIKRQLRIFNEPYPVSVNMVNGKLHIGFSGNPNRDLCQIDKIVNYLVNLEIKLYGCIYINDANSSDFLKFKCVKVFNDQVKEIDDKNFTFNESKSIFE